MDPGFRLGSTSLDLGGTSRLGHRALRLRGRRVHLGALGSAAEVPPHAPARRVRDAPRARSPRRLREPRRVPRAVRRARCDHAARTACSRSAPTIPNAWRSATPHPVLRSPMARRRRSDWRIRRTRASRRACSTSSVERQAAEPLDVVLTFPGIHNAQNACAALILAGVRRRRPCGLRSQRAPTSSGRRAASRSSARSTGVAVVDDYAHHPTEVAAAIDAARQRYAGRRLIAIHTPHTYSRVSRLLEDYRRSFTGADVVVIGPIEEARERGMPKTVSSQDVADRAGPRARGARRRLE